jgi:serine/threonine protein kinase
MKPYDSSVDVYSLGLILFELLVPLATDMERQVVLSKLKAKLRFPPAFYADLNMISEVSSLLLLRIKIPPVQIWILTFFPDISFQKKLLKKMLSHRPHNRPKAAEVLRCVKRWTAFRLTNAWQLRYP